MATADNIPVILHSPCLSEYGVDTAAELVIKPTGGYGIISGGATAEGGNPDRVEALGKPLISIELDFLHYGSNPHEVSGGIVPAICTCVTSSCDIGVISLLPVVPSSS